MATRLALEKTAVAWGTPDTSNKLVDVDLAIAFAEILNKYIEALIWCGRSADFELGGTMYEGYKRIRDELLTESPHEVV